ncbi:MAG: histidinol-phosphatase [Ruminococcaceae bacterium]|nr:histidinol-phosphatase [Oscillospiraceae bacterium]
MEILFQIINVVKWLLLASIFIGVIVLVRGALKRTRQIVVPRSQTTKKINNYHTHTIFCDGKNTAEEMVLKAIELGMDEIGFSGHSYLSGEPDWTMSLEDTKKYKETVLELKEKYKDKINVRLGIEQDYWSPTDDLDDYEYVLGAVHSVFGDDTTWSSIDYTIENVSYCIKNYFDDDKMAMIEKYFELVADLYNKTKCSVICHFNLPTRFNTMFGDENGKPFVDMDDPRYIAAERKALEKIATQPVIIEINTGAMARGYTKEPYPNERALEIISKLQIPVLFSSDCHDVNYLTFGIEIVEELVEKYDLNLLEKL